MLSRIMAVNLNCFKAQVYFVLGPVAAAAAFPYNTLSMSAHGKARVMAF